MENVVWHLYLKEFFPKKMIKDKNGSHRSQEKNLVVSSIRIRFKDYYIFLYPYSSKAMPKEYAF